MVAVSRFLKKTYGHLGVERPVVEKSAHAKLALVGHQARVKRPTHGRRRKKARLYAVVVPKNRLRTIHETQNFGHGHPSHHRHRWVPRPHRRKRNSRRARRAA